MSSGLNPTYELEGLLPVLEQKRLIDRTKNEIAVLGVTTRGSLSHAAEIFLDASPNVRERASINLAEAASSVPVRRTDVSVEISDRFELDQARTGDLLDRALELGFVDVEGDGNSQILFNGNLYRRNSAFKILRTLDSLSTSEKNQVNELK